MDPEGHDSILLGAYLLIREHDRDHLRQIEGCKPDANMEPVIITQVPDHSILQTYEHFWMALSKCVSTSQHMIVRKQICM